MTAEPVDVARQWLERQIAELGGLRNAGTRAPEFKAWRQNTLTVIQRIWPGDVRRSDRFRRIPFRPAGTPAGIKMDDRGVRESFERGCGEAGVVLRQLIGELTLLGIEAVTEPAASPDPGVPTLERAEPAPQPRVTPARPAAPEPKPARAETPRTARAHAEPARPAPRVQAEPPAPRPAARPAPVTPHAESDDGARVADFLSASPIFRPRPAAPPPPLFAHTSSREIASIAAALEFLGVPLGRRKPLATALMELAHTLDSGTPEWSDLRDGVQLVMEHPAVARRALPHLLPFIQTAA